MLKLRVKGMFCWNLCLAMKFGLDKASRVGERKRCVEGTAYRRDSSRSPPQLSREKTMATTQSKKGSASKTGSTLSKAESALIDAYRRSANYQSVGQIYLFDNPLREPLKEEHIKPRLLGHRGTTPGLNFIDVHL
jgi:hypothetical protein